MSSGYQLSGFDNPFWTEQSGLHNPLTSGEGHAMILVTTAGKVGTEAALLLRQRELPVRVLVRDPGKAKTLADAGAEVAAGDLGVPASIDAAMTGVTAVILVSPAVPAQELNV